MEWEIIPFVGMGPIKFGMNPNEVFEILGPPERVREGPGTLREARQLDLPIIRYEDSLVSEIEAFHNVENVHYKNVPIFEGDGRSVLKFLEQENGQAEISVGIILLKDLGITVGRIDEEAKGDHSITAFRKGLWDDDPDFEPISFL